MDSRIIRPLSTPPDAGFVDLRPRLGPGTGSGGGSTVLHGVIGQWSRLLNVVRYKSKY